MRVNTPQFAVWTAALLIGIPGFASDEPQFQWRTHDGRPHARAVNILYLRSETGGCAVASVDLDSSITGNEFEECSERGLAREPRPFLSVEQADGDVVLMTALSGAFTCGEYFLESAGTIRLRLTIGFKENCAQAKVIEEDVHFEAPTASDLAFLRIMGSPDFHRRACGRDPVEAYGTDANIRKSSSSEEDYRSRLTIGLIFSATQAEEPLHVLAGMDARRSAEVIGYADALWRVAQDHAESSYAPYAAFFAGMVYSGTIDKDVPERLSGTEYYPAVRAHSRREPSEGALDFAAQRGDDFLKPLALRFRAWMAARVDDWEASDRFLAEAGRACQGQGSRRQANQKLAEELREFRDKHR